MRERSPAANPADPTTAVAAAAAPATPTPAVLPTATAAAAAVLPSATTATAATAADRPRGGRFGQTSGNRRRRRASPVPGGRRSGVRRREPRPVPGTGPVPDHQQDVREQQTPHVVADGVAGTTAAAIAATTTTGGPVVSAASFAPEKTGRPTLGIRVETAEEHLDFHGFPPSATSPSAAAASPSHSVVPPIFLIDCLRPSSSSSYDTRSFYAIVRYYVLHTYNVLLLYT